MLKAIWNHMMLKLRGPLLICPHCQKHYRADQHRFSPFKPNMCYRCYYGDGSPRQLVGIMALSHQELLDGMRDAYIREHSEDQSNLPDRIN